MQELGATLNIRTSRGLTLDRIRKAIQPVTSPESFSKTFFKVDSGEIQPLANVPLKVVDLETYTDNVFFTPDTFPLLWHSFEESNIDFSREQHIFYRKIKLQFEKDGFPSLCIQEVPELNVGGNSKIRGLYTLNAMPALTAVGFYGGLPDYQTHFDTFREGVQGKNIIGREYSMAYGTSRFEVNAGKVSGRLRFINDDFPNTIICFMQEFGGVGLTTEAVQAGDPLAINYSWGRVDLKWGMYRVISEERVKRFFTDTKPEQLYSKIVALQKYLNDLIDSDKEYDSERHVELIDIVNKLIYIYHTPAAMIYLSFSRIVAAKSWLTMMEVNCKWRTMLRPQNQIHHSIWIISTLYYLDKVEDCLLHLEESSSELSVFIRQTLFKLSFTLKVTQMVKALQLTSEFLSQRGPEKTEWEQFISKNSQMLHSYNWEEDESSPLCDVILPEWGSGKPRLLLKDVALREFIEKFELY